MRTFLCVLLLGSLLAGDTVVAGGKKVKGAIVSEGQEVVINIYNSTVKGVVFGTERFPKERVKKVVRTFPLPHHDFQRRLKEANSVESCLELATWAKENKLKEERHAG